MRFNSTAFQLGGGLGTIGSMVYGGEVLTEARVALSEAMATTGSVDFTSLLLDTPEVGTGGGAETTVFYRGMTFGEASEAVETQSLSAERIAVNQALNPGAAGSGAYLTMQEETAIYYGDLAGGSGRGLGPAVLRIEVPALEFSSFAARSGISVETPILRGPFPGATETLIPFEYLEEFNSMATFRLHL